MLHKVLNKYLMIAGFVCLLVAQAKAAVTLDSVSGASRWESTGTNTYTIYGGEVGGLGVSCASQNNIDPCDSCINSTALQPCNSNMVYSSLALRLNFSTDSGLLSSRNVKIYLGSTEITSIIANKGSSTFYFSQTWSEWLTAMSEAIGTSAVFTISVGITKDSSDELESAEKVTIRFVYNYVDGASTTNTYFHADCNTSTCSSQANNHGYCHFSLFPGDQKAYIDDLQGTCTFLANSTEGIKWKSLRFYYHPSFGNDAAAAGAIRNNSAKFDLDISDEGNQYLVDDSIGNGTSDLLNGQRYCFKIASIDETGNVHSFTPTGAHHCVTPAAVAGVLDSKKCFIATAAYGTPMDERVETFRQFRNQILLKSDWGKAFVSWYYSNSLKYAKYISGNEFLRSSVRFLLWPLLLFAHISLNYGIITAVIYLLVMISVSIFLIRISFVKIIKPKPEIK